jgi:hypothetical protein
MRVGLFTFVPTQTATAFPKTYFEIFPRVSLAIVTVTVGVAEGLSAASNAGMTAVLGTKSSRKQFGLFCAKSLDDAQHSSKKTNNFGQHFIA